MSRKKRSPLVGSRGANSLAPRRHVVTSLFASVLIVGFMALPSMAVQKRSKSKMSGRRGPVSMVPPKKEVRPKIAAAMSGKPKIECDEQSFDFGETWVGPRLEHTYTIKNTGNAALEITKVKPSCGCTSVGSYPKRIEPGESGEFKFALNSQKLHGRYRKSITVSSNDPDTPSFRLQLAGYCKRYVDVTPRNANFGKISGEKSSERVLKIINNTDTPLELSLQKAGTSSFHFELVEKEPGEKYELKVKSITPMKTGRSRGSVVLKTNVESQETITISASAVVPERIELQPNEIRLSTRTKGVKGYTRTIRLTNYGTNPVKILAATVNDPQIKATFSERTAGQAYLLNVAFPDNFDITKKSNLVLTVKTDDKEKPEIRVPILSSEPAVANKRPAKRKRPAEGLVGQPVPSFSVKTVEGKPLSMDTMKGSVTVLDFFAVNCGFCKKQIPRLETVRKAYASKGVRFITVSQTMRKRFDDAATKAKIRDLGFGGELVIDSDNKLGPLFKATSYPTMVVIGKQGRIDAVNVGNVADLETRMGFQLDALLQGHPIPQIANAREVPTRPSTKPNRQAAKRPSERLVGSLAPAFSMKTMDGKTLSSDNFKDAPATVLNFVAANCGYCKKQVPRLEKMRAGFEAKGVRFFNVVQTMRKPYSADEVKKIFGAVGSKITLAHDVTNEVGKKYKATGFPTMVVVGKSGRIEAVNVGNIGDLETRVSGQLNALIAGKKVPQVAAARKRTPTPKTKRADANSLIGKPAPSIALKTFEGKAVNNADFAKHPATILNFVASNCGYCKKQSPRIDKIRAEYESKGVRFVNVVMTMRKEYTPEEVKGIFRGKLGLKMELAHDPKNVAGGKFGVRGFPMMAVIGRSGKVEAINSGNLGDLETRVKSQLDALIAGKPLPTYKAVAKKSNRRPAEGLVGKTAPKFSMMSLEGRAVSSDDFANHPATILNFVASNCGFCKRQVPGVEKVRQQYESKGIRFVNVVMTMRKEYTPEEVKSVFSGIGSKIELAHDPKNVVGRKYLAKSFPTMIVVDKSGTISAVHVGAKPNLVKELSGQLDGLIKKANSAG